MTYSNDARPSAGSYSNDPKNVPSYSNDAKPDYTTGYLLKEDAFYLLLETGDRIVVNRAGNYVNDAEPS